MEHAVFINNHAVRRAMGRVPYTPGRKIVARPHYWCGAFQGYKIILNGAAMTNNQIEALS